VLADRERLHRVFAGLVGNAIESTPAGGWVRIGAHASEGGEVRFGVTDSGGGIPPEEAPQLFTRFWQLQRTRRGGSGLGLAVAKALVEAHGGRIWVQTQEGLGSSVCFTLPRQEAAGSGAEQDLAESGARSAPGRVVTNRYHGGNGW